MPSQSSVRLTIKRWAEWLGKLVAYEVPKSKASIKQNRFEFVIEGKTFDLPLLKFLSGEKIEEIAAAEEKGGMTAVAATYSLFGEAGTPAGDAVRKLDQDQMEALSSAYMEASGISVGESEASTDSSKSTERPSDTTSSSKV